MLLYTKNRLGGPLLPGLSPDLPMEYRYRTVEFDGNTSNMIIIHQPGDGCLLLVDPQFTSEEAYPGLPENLAKNFEMSNIGQVEQNGDNMAVPSRYFGAEPARNWCYYFEKAELARQYGDWEEVVMHYETASSSGFTALQPVENLVFIEAFARLGNTDKASRLTETCTLPGPQPVQGIVRHLEACRGGISRNPGRGHETNRPVRHPARVQMTPPSSSFDLSSARFAFLDLETTGLCPWSGDRICEVGIVLTEGRRIKQQIQFLVNPERPLSLGAASTNKLTDEELAGQPIFAEMADEVAEWLKGTVVVEVGARQAILESGERGLRGQIGVAVGGAIDRALEDRISRERRGIVAVLVAARDLIHALAHQIVQRLTDLARLTPVAQPTRDRLRNAEPPVHFPQQQQPAVAAHPTAVEPAHVLTPTKESEAQLRTLCHRRRGLLETSLAISQAHFHASPAFTCLTFMNDAG